MKLLPEKRKIINHGGNFGKKKNNSISAVHFKNRFCNINAMIPNIGIINSAGNSNLNLKPRPSNVIIKLLFFVTCVIYIISLIFLEEAVPMFPLDSVYV
jgi:hypothetical protein